MPAIVGRKVGMSQIFLEDGTRLPVTIIEAGPCVVIEKKTPAKFGYSALKVGFGDAMAYRLNKPDLGQFKKLGLDPKKVIRELRLPEDEIASFDVGSVLGAGLFADVKKVDVTGVSIGKGTQGVMKRYHFGGFRETHGGHEYKRHAGSIGQREFPGYVFVGKRMEGHMGDERKTTQNLKLVKVDAEKNLLFVNGSIPGAKNGIVIIRDAIKSRKQQIF